MRLGCSMSLLSFGRYLMQYRVEVGGEDFYAMSYFGYSSHPILDLVTFENWDSTLKHAKFFFDCFCNLVLFLCKANCDSVSNTLLHCCTRLICETTHYAWQVSVTLSVVHYCYVKLSAKFKNESHSPSNYLVDRRGNECSFAGIGSSIRLLRKVGRREGREGKRIGALGDHFPSLLINQILPVERFWRKMQAHIFPPVTPVFSSILSTSPFPSVIAVQT